VDNQGTPAGDCDRYSYADFLTNLFGVRRLVRLNIFTLTTNNNVRRTKKYEVTD